MLLSYIKVNLLIIIFDKEICIITKKLYIINMSHIFQETMDKEKREKKVAYKILHYFSYRIISSTVSSL